jgi:MoaA/NifB/PqqE/SkfB family radical SAM enzyme
VARPAGRPGVIQRAGEAARRRLSLLTHRIHSLPILVLMPHSGCNCRCVMCDIWTANRARREISRDDLARHVGAWRRLRVRWVVLSGGEPLMHANLWALCALLRDLPARITLLSTGLLLERHAADVTRWCDEVIVSLDGSRPVHDAIRRVAGAYDRLAAGVRALRRHAPGFRVTGRCVVQRRNFRDLPGVIAAARALGLDQISFLAADVSTTAFNRPVPWDEARRAEVGLGPGEPAELAAVVEECIRSHAADFAAGFVAEDPAKLRRIPRYYAALLGEGPFPAVACNAPWVSAVVEADGTVRPCFFHRALGNLGAAPPDAILNGPAAVAFRRGLDVTRDPTCARCVCTLHLAPGAPLPPAAP